MGRKGNRGQRPQKKEAPKGKFNDPTLTHMREVAFGKDMTMAIHRTMDRSERMRDDSGMLAAAEAKRQRKAAKLAGK